MMHIKWQSSKTASSIFMARIPASLCRLLRHTSSSLLLLALLSFAVLFAIISLSLSPISCRAFSDPACKNHRAFSLYSWSGPRNPTVTIFSAPIRAFLNSSDDPQYQALLSWLMLVPTPKIVLLGNDPSFYKVSQEFSGKISVESDIDYNMKGTPLFHSMFARAQQAETEISIMVNADVLLLQDFMEALHKTHSKHHDWVLFAKHWDLAGAVPVSFVRSAKGIVEMISTVPDLPATCNDVTQFIRSNGFVDASEPNELWAWNNNWEIPILTTEVPPFSLRRGTYEKWLLQHILEESKTRAVVDASEAAANIRIISNFSSIANDSDYSWERNVNVYLSKTGNLSGESVCSDLVAAWRLVDCSEPTVQNLCMIQQQQRKGACKDDVGSSVIANDQLAKADAKESESFRPWQGLLLPHTLEDLLPQVADENGVVVMVGVTWNYKEMLLSFICRAREVGIRNVLVAAFDEAVMEFAYMQGLAVYFEKNAEDYQNVIGSDGECIFASECFRHVSKLKSSSVLRVLTKGYHVLWSDVDVVWFHNPIKELLEFGPGTLTIQSDEPNQYLPENSIRGANSGFYLAFSDNSTIRAFEAIIAHAMGTQLTEQPSFYDVLCGSDGQLRVGHNECRLDVAGGGLRTIFLSHLRYPNGFVDGLWDDATNTLDACAKRGCVVLHNNFIAGKVNKLKRFIEKRLWFSDATRRMCLHPWHPLSSIPLPQFQSHLFHALNIPLSPPSNPQ